MERKKASDYPQELLDLFHEYQHGDMTRRDFFDRIQKFAEHLERVGVALGRATVAFNDAVGSLEHRVLPSARRFRELGAAVGAEIDPMKTIDVQPRSLTAPELPGVEPPQ